MVILENETQLGLQHFLKHGDHFLLKDEQFDQLNVGYSLVTNSPSIRAGATC